MAGKEMCLARQKERVQAANIRTKKNICRPQSYDGEPITYQEFDVNNRIPGQDRDSQRFVVGSDGSVYYTDEHYHGFVKIK